MPANFVNYPFSERQLGRSADIISSTVDAMHHDSVSDNPRISDLRN
jgi:hypothetical protein